MIGSRLGPFAITAKLGEGGMGEVYRATDSRLDREVAIKVLPAAFVADPERLARFEREAKLLAQLHHPHIASIFGIEEAGGVRALVMELVEGPTLAEKLAPGRLSPDEAVAIGKEIAEALEAAHEKGIVHRDLKPANVKLAPDGSVKVLDFGLAKALEPAGGVSSAEVANSPTVTFAATRQGVILGTAAYMAPEQARGGAVDKRADIWAFGVVLYEMLAGGSLFGSGTVTDTLAGVLKNEIDFAQLPPETHAELARLLRRCLERNPKNRLHDIADARIVLDQILSGRADLVGVPAAAASPAPPLWRRALPWVGGVVAGAAVAAILSTRGAGPAARPSAASASIRTLVSTGVALNPAVSPDGRTLAFESERDGENRVWIKDLISGSESVLVDRSSGLPDVSPDGTTVLFVAEGEGEQTDLYRVALATREDRLVARNATYGAWSPDGRSVLFLRDHDATSDGHGELIAVDIASGEERRLHHDAAKAMGESRWSPDGRRIAVALNSMQAGWSDRIGILDVASGAFAELSLDRGGARGTKVRGLAWISPREIALLLLDFGEIISSSGRIAVLEVGRGTLESLLPLAAVGWGLDLSGPGSLIVGIGSTDQNLREVSREAGGRWSPASNLTEGPFSDRQPVYSPDGRSILFTSNRSGNLDIWRRVRATGELRRLTDHDAEDWDPALSPDGKKLLFSSNRSGRFQLWIAESDGSSPRQITDFENAQNPTMTADGAWIVFVRQQAGEDRDGIWKVRPDGTDAALVSAGAFLVPDVSPDGKYVALRGAGRKRVVRIADGVFLEEDLAGTDRYRWSVEGSKTFLWALGGLANRNVRRFPFDPERGALGPAEATEVLGGESNAETFGVAPDGSAMTFASFANRRGQLVRIDGLTGLPR